MMLILFAALKTYHDGENEVRSFIWLLQACGSIYDKLWWVKDIWGDTRAVALRCLALHFFQCETCSRCKMYPDYLWLSQIIQFGAAMSRNLSQLISDRVFFASQTWRWPGSQMPCATGCWLRSALNGWWGKAEAARKHNDRRHGVVWHGHWKRQIAQWPAVASSGQQPVWLVEFEMVCCSDVHQFGQILYQSNVSYAFWHRSCKSFQKCSTCPSAGLGRCLAQSARGHFDISKQHRDTLGILGLVMCHGVGWCSHEFWLAGQSSQSSFLFWCWEARVQLWSETSWGQSHDNRVGSDIKIITVLFMRTLCDGIRAEDRANWLVEHQQMTMEAKCFCCPSISSSGLRFMVWISINVHNVHRWTRCRCLGIARYSNQA